MKTICVVVVWTVLAFSGTIAAFAQRVEILSAYYGIGNYRVDVTERVQRLASNGESFEVSSRNLGLDPERTQGSHLQMTVIDRSGERVQREYGEGDYVDFR
jgi:hypothetical protein